MYVARLAFFRRRTMLAICPNEFRSPERKRVTASSSVILSPAETFSYRCESDLETKRDFVKLFTIGVWHTAFTPATLTANRREDEGKPRMGANRRVTNRKPTADTRRLDGIPWFNSITFANLRRCTSGFPGALLRQTNTSPEK